MNRQMTKTVTKTVTEPENCRRPIRAYRIEFGNGDRIQTKEFGMGMPVVRTCDLNGDGGGTA